MDNEVESLALKVKSQTVGFCDIDVGSAHNVTYAIGKCLLCLVGNGLLCDVVYPGKHCSYHHGYANEDEDHIQER